VPWIIFKSIIVAGLQEKKSLSSFIFLPSKLVCCTHQQGDELLNSTNLNSKNSHRAAKIPTELQILRSKESLQESNQEQEHSSGSHPIEENSLF